MANSEKEPKPTNPLSVLGGFFVAITIGGSFLSIGIVGSYRWFFQLPSKIPVEVAIASLIIGIGIDSWTIARFWRRREKLFQEL